MQRETCFSLAAICAVLLPGYGQAQPPAATLSADQLAEYGPVPKDDPAPPRANADDSEVDVTVTTSATSGDANHTVANGTSYDYAHADDDASMGAGHGGYGESEHAGGNHAWNFALGSFASSMFGYGNSAQPAPSASSAISYGAVMVRGEGGAQSFYYIRQDHYQNLVASLNKPQVLKLYSGLGPNPVGMKYRARQDYIYYWYPVCGDQLNKKKVSISKPADREVIVTCQ